MHPGGISDETDAVVARRAVADKGDRRGVGVLKSNVPIQDGIKTALFRKITVRLDAARPLASAPFPHCAISRWWMPQHEIMPSESS